MNHLPFWFGLMASAGATNGNGAHAAPGDRPAPGAGPLREGPTDWEEVRLTDLVRTVWQRRTLLATFVLLGLVGSVAAVVMTDPEYEASATIVPLDEPDIIQNWLRSRQAAELVVQAQGPELYEVLAPDQWDAGREEWIGTPPGLEVLGARLQERVTVAGSSASRASERLITVTAAMPTATLSRDVAQGYVTTLETLRPHLEAIAKQELFDQYYDGSNAQAAEARAETAARQKNFWLELDSAVLPADPSKPRPALYVTLGVVLGGMLGVLAVFGAEWLSRFRTEFAGRDELALPTPTAPIHPAAPAPALDEAGVAEATPRATAPRPGTGDGPDAAPSRFSSAPPVPVAPPLATAHQASAGNGAPKRFTVVRKDGDGATATAPDASPQAGSPAPDDAPSAMRFWKPRR